MFASRARAAGKIEDVPPQGVLVTRFRENLKPAGFQSNSFTVNDVYIGPAASHRKIVAAWHITTPDNHGGPQVLINSTQMDLIREIRNAQNYYQNTAMFELNWANDTKVDITFDCQGSFTDSGASLGIWTIYGFNGTPGGYSDRVWNGGGPGTDPVSVDVTRPANGAAIGAGTGFSLQTWINPDYNGILQQYSRYDYGSHEDGGAGDVTFGTTVGNGSISVMAASWGP